MSGTSRRVPLASWEPESGRWLAANGTSEDLFGQSEPFSGRYPTRGMTRSGRLYQLPTLVPPTGGNESSSSPGHLLPTPAVRDYKGGVDIEAEMQLRRSRGAGAYSDLATAAEYVGKLLPTPSANQYGDNPDTWEARRQRWRETYQQQQGGAGNGFGLTTAMAVQALLKTPTSNLATNGGSQPPEKRKAGGHGPTLADQVEHDLPLLPTPLSGEARHGSPNQHRAGRADRLNLPTPRATRGGSGTETMYALGGQRTDEGRPQGEVLLPTPDASVGTGGRTSKSMEPTRPSGAKASIKLEDVVHHRLLPTPGAALADGGQTNRSGDRIGEPLLPSIAKQAAEGALLPTPDASMDSEGERPVVQWGPYEAAIRRWESVLGRPAPSPTEPGRTGQRLSPRLVEFMMGLPEGWVTGVPDLSRNGQLRALGNGVVPQQAILALSLLLPHVPSQVIENL